MRGVPEHIKTHFDFHDSFLLAALAEGNNFLLFIGNADDGSPPYVKVIFENTSKVDGGKDLIIRAELDEEGTLFSNCRYIYENVLLTENGYQVKLTLWTPEADRCLTVECEDIEFAEDITIEEILAKKQI